MRRFRVLLTRAPRALELLEQNQERRAKTQSLDARMRETTIPMQRATSPTGATIIGDLRAPK